MTPSRHATRNRFVQAQKKIKLYAPERITRTACPKQKRKDVTMRDGKRDQLD